MKPITILLVEDNLGDQQLFSLALESFNDIRLEIASDGCEALQFLRREGKYVEAPEPDLVILDFNLPKRNGPEVLSKIKQSRTLKHLPVVMFTSAEGTELTLAACKQANLYLVKPDGGSEYFAAVKGLVKFCRNIVSYPEMINKYAEELSCLLRASGYFKAYALETLEGGVEL